MHVSTVEILEHENLQQSVFASLRSSLSRDEIVTSEVVFARSQRPQRYQHTSRVRAEVDAHRTVSADASVTLKC